jgi:hypothetical protein
LLFDRVYKLQVGQGTNGVEITDLRINFDIVKTAKKNPNKSRIQIWNLQKSTRQMCEKPNTRCILYAGYADQDGPILIFSGGITIAWSKYDLPDIITEFELTDGGQEIRDTTISVGYDKNIKSSQILSDVSKKMGLPLNIPSNLADKTWQNGLSFYGPARTLLDKVTKAAGQEWSIQNGNVQVIETGMVTTRQGIVIAADSGLIGSPERERSAYEGNTAEPKKKPAKTKSKAKAKVQNDPLKEFDGWKVKTLLLPQLNPGDRVQLDTRDVQGIFRCDYIQHKGDSHDGDWESELKVIDPAKKLKPKGSKGGATSRGTPLGDVNDTDYDPDELE